MTTAAAGGGSRTVSTDGFWCERNKKETLKPVFDSSLRGSLVC